MLRKPHAMDANTQTLNLNQPVSTCLIGSTWKHKRSLKNSWKQVPQGINTKKTTKQWHVELVLCLLVYGTTIFCLCDRWEAPPFSKTSSWIAKSPASWMQCFLKPSIWMGGIPTPLKHISQMGWWHSQSEKNLPNHQPGMYSKEPCTLEMMCFLRIKETTLVVKKYDTCSIETASLKGICDCCFHGNRRFIFPRYAHILLGLLHPFNQKCGIKKRACLFNVAFQGKMYSSTVK